METVLVQFPDGRRETPAYYETDTIRLSHGSGYRPAPIPGYRFEQTIAGDWYAFRDFNPQ